MMVLADLGIGLLIIGVASLMLGVGITLIKEAKRDKSGDCSGTGCHECCGDKKDVPK